MVDVICNLLIQLGNDQNLTGVNHNNLSQNIDAIVVKRLSQTNTLISGRDSHQTHLAITGEDMNIFDTNSGSINVVDLRQNNRFAKEFVVKNHLILLENNFNLLKGISSNQERSNIIDSYTHAAETVRSNGDIQVEISFLTLDETYFKRLREMMNSGDYLVFLRKRNTYEFVCLAIPSRYNLGESGTIIL